MPRLDINNGHVRDAKKDARPGAKAYDIIDTRARGLLLRVGPRGCRWAWKHEFNHRTRRMDLGDVDEWSIEDARTIAGEATKLIRERKGLPDAAWLAAQRARFGKAPPPDWTVGLGQPFMPSPEPKPWKGTPDFMAWTYRDAVDRYIAHTTATKKRATAADYRKTLTNPAFTHFMKLPVTRITVDEMQKAINAVAKAGHHASAVGMTTKQRTFWKWLGRPGVCEGSMITTAVMARLHKPERVKVPVVPGAPPVPKKRKKHFPLMPELGRLVALARSGALDPAFDVAILLLVAAVQRNHAVCSAAREDFADCDEEPGWGVWRVPPLHRKGASEEDEVEERTHAVPIPPAVWAVVKDRIDSLDGHFLFPAFRTWRGKMLVGHMHENTLSHHFAAMPDIIARPHDLRRALRSQGRKLLKVTPKEISLILDHAEGKAGSVTEKHYSDDELLDVKRPILEQWWEMVERHAEASTPTLPPVDEIRTHITAAKLHRKNRKPKAAAAAAA